MRPVIDTQRGLGSASSSLSTFDLVKNVLLCSGFETNRLGRYD